ncbi:MAG: rod shape-determining protein RodA [Oscillospiraceae bacterium]|nr:rod shape-determining protein RodA [Oscillospiraceae bacterium]
MLNRKLFKNIDFFLLSMVLIAGTIGIIAISSAVSTFINPSQFVITQIVSLVVGLVVIAVIIKIDYEYLCGLSYAIYGLCLLLLILVLIPQIGHAQLGGQRWIRIGPIGFQPTEFVKIGFIITFAKHLSLIDEDINKPKNIGFLALHAAPIIALTLMQPDLGTTLVFVSIALMMIWFAGINYKYILAAIGGFVAALPIIWFFVLRDYQQLRIISFFNPYLDPAGAGFQVLQSRIAVGSGQIFGRGYLRGSTQFGFLPERHNDFIFSVISEEFGFIGSMVVLLLLLGITLRCLYIANKAKNSLGKYIALGVSGMLMFQTIQSIGMAIGLMPVTGVPLPFISYGGSSMLANMMAVGLVLNVRYRYKVINF